MSHAVPEAPNRNHAFARALVGELAASGVRDVCLCPGSRSTPLVGAVRADDRLRIWTHLDERSAGYFALGLGRTSGRPVALVCTSGTAAANFHPAVAEACHARLPLVVLTADRPPEHRGWGAGQTIDQIHLYGSHVRAFVEAPLPEATGTLLRYARALACRLVATAMARPRGPVHVNLPFREPLEPVPVPGDVPADLEERDPAAAHGRPGGPYTRAIPPAPRPDPERVERLAAWVRSRPRGVVVLGPMTGLDAGGVEEAVRVSRAAGWPVLADVLSSARCGPHAKEAPLVGSYDALLRVPGFTAAHAPQAVLRLGDAPTSKALRLWLEQHAEAEHVLLDPDGAWADPSHLAAEVIADEPAPLLAALAARLEAERPAREAAWLEAFRRADHRAARAIDAAVARSTGLFEPEIVRRLGERLPEDALLFVSNSMPVRDADGFLPVRPERLPVTGQRGANGIDGIVSAALGASAGHDGPTVLLTGDLALLHDLGGLLAARRHALRLVIVALNNDGGGIFSFLPAARFREALDFERLFTTPHGLDLAHAAALFGLDYRRTPSREAFAEGLDAALASPRSVLLEVPVEREASVAHHGEIWNAVASTLAGEGAP